MTAQTATSTDYVLGYEDPEYERLIRQARWLDELSEPLFRDAGIRPGMRVLDVGSGAGDVSFLISRLLNGSGSVLGIDQSEQSVDLATRRAAAAGIGNVRFEVADARDVPGTSMFDAVVGRLVLMYLPDPSATLATLAQRVRPGGIITFQEYDIEAMTCEPPAPLTDLTLERVKQTFRRVGAHTAMGPKLAATVVAAGLPYPEVRILGRMHADPDAETLQQLTLVTSTLLAPMEATGVATAAEVQIDTLYPRLREEIRTHRCGVRPPTLYGAWSRLPQY